MNIHYALFKHATWLSDRDVEGPEAVEEDFDLDVSLTASCFCKAAENPAKKAMVCLSKMLRDVSSNEWGPAVLAFGPVLSWPQARLRLLRRGFFTVVGQLWRKLLFPCTQYPWKLACLIDGEMSPLEKQRCAEDLFAQPLCCLDGFARKLRETQKSPDKLLEPDVLEFLQAVFERIVPTSTYIERLFARLTEWSGSSNQKGPKRRLSAVAAKHCVHTYEHLVKRWRKRTLKQKPTLRHKRRPDWMQGRLKGKARNGWHAFSQDCFRQHPELLRLSREDRQARLSAEWAQADKRRWAAVARSQNLQSRNAMDSSEAAVAEHAEIVGGPWNVAAADGFPLARHSVVAQCNKTQTLANEFHEKHNILQPEEADSLLGAPPEPWSLFPTCTINGCEHCMPEEQQESMQRLRTLLWRAVLQKAPASKSTGKEPLLLSFQSARRDATLSLVVAFHTLRAPLQAAVLLLHPVEMPDLAEQGVVVSLDCFSQSGRRELQLESDSVALARLARQASDWKLNVLDVGPVRQINRFVITASHPFDDKDGVDGAGLPVLVDPDTEAALAAFDELNPSSKKSLSKRRFAAFGQVGHAEPSGAKKPKKETESKKQKSKEEKKKTNK